MMTLTIHKRSLVCLAVLSALISACAATSTPSITELKVVTGAAQVTVGQEVAIAAGISNPSGEPVTFSWLAQLNGEDMSKDIVTASQEVAAATYRPATAGSHIITLQMLNKQKAVIAASNITIVAQRAAPPATATPEPALPTAVVPATEQVPSSGVTDTPVATVQPQQNTPTSEPSATSVAVQAAPAGACPGGEVSAAPQSMPFWVYGAAGRHFCPSGFMGDASDVQISQGDVVGIQYKFQGRGSVCGYTPCRWAGIYWLNPAITGSQAWAARANSGYNLSQAKAVRFRARSTTGARVEFFVGGVTDTNLRYPSSLPKQSVGLLTLTSDWQEFSIALSNVDAAALGYVIDGFGWSASWDNNAGRDGISFEIADIRYE